MTKITLKGLNKQARKLKNTQKIKMHDAMDIVSRKAGYLHWEDAFAQLSVPAEDTIDRMSFLPDGRRYCFTLSPRPHERFGFMVMAVIEGIRGSFPFISAEWEQKAWYLGNDYKHAEYVLQILHDTMGVSSQQVTELQSLAQYGARPMHHPDGRPMVDVVIESIKNQSDQWITAINKNYGLSSELSKKQKELMEYMSRNVSTKQTAEILSISESTVWFHIKNIKLKVAKADAIQHLVHFSK